MFLLIDDNQSIGINFKAGLYVTFLTILSEFHLKAEDARIPQILRAMF